MKTDNTAELIIAVEAALAGDWHKAHNIAQDYNDNTACWIHSLLHKIEPDEWNSRYWYRRTDKEYEDFPDATEEFKAILSLLNKR